MAFVVSKREVGPDVVSHPELNVPVALAPRMGLRSPEEEVSSLPDIDRSFAGAQEWPGL